MAKTDIDIDKLLSIDVCPLCGKKECRYEKSYAEVKGFTKNIVKTYIKKGKNGAAGVYAASLGIWAKRKPEYLRSIHEATKTDNSMSTISLFNHYKSDLGAPLTTNQIGIHDRVSNLVQKPGAFTRSSGSIHSRFISQIQNGERVGFKNTYDFSTEARNVNDPLWSIGKSVVNGGLCDVSAELRGNNYNISGVFNYGLFKNYSNPAGIFNWFENNLASESRKPFGISGIWKQPVNFDVDKQTYENKIKPVLDETNGMSGAGMSSWDMLSHFLDKSGRELTLTEIGIHDKVRDLMHKPGAFGREGSIQSRFISQIQRGERVDFENQYNFGDERSVLPQGAERAVTGAGIANPLWGIGGATVSGKLEGVSAERVGDGYNVSGVINYKLEDNFTDPWDLFNLKKEDINWGGKPFYIKGEWKENVNFGVSKEVYESKIKPLIH